MRIGGCDTRDRVLIVAEIGNNHEGDVGVARRLVEAAAAAGADAVKFQTFDPAHYVARADAVRFARLERFRLSGAEFAELATLARSLGLAFVSTPFDLDSVAVLEPLVDAFKISSGDNTFFPLIRAVARTGAPVIASTGLADTPEVEQLVATIRETWAEQGVAGELALLHCVSSYPVEPAEANLRAIDALSATFDCEVGYSDHTTGVDASLVAVALGARLIEKHFTLDKAYSDFRDHALSADPPELAELVRRVRAVEQMLGAPTLAVQPGEAGGLVAMRRSVVAAGDLARGHVLEPGDLTWVRPGGGLPPGAEQQLLGRRLVRDLVAGERLEASDVEANNGGR